MADGKSFWAWIGLGCAALGVVGLLATLGGGFWLFRATKQFGESMKDPEARTERVLDVLGAEALPDGYHAMIALRIPFVMRVAILTDAAPRADGQVSDLGERGLIFFEMFNIGQDMPELRDYFEGRTDDPDVLRRNNINVEIDEVIGRGVRPLGDATLMYVAQRGRVAAHGVRGDGLTSVVLVDCPDDQRTRIAIWYAPDVSTAEAEDSLVGTPADPDALASFLGNFRFCPEA